MNNKEKLSIKLSINTPNYFFQEKYEKIYLFNCHNKNKYLPREVVFITLVPKDL